MVVSLEILGSCDCGLRGICFVMSKYDGCCEIWADFWKFWKARAWAPTGNNGMELLWFVSWHECIWHI